eukprot:scaffold2636_cov340-Pavlova_lutheri.AAC.65
MQNAICKGVRGHSAWIGWPVGCAKNGMDDMTMNARRCIDTPRYRWRSGLPCHTNIIIERVLGDPRPKSSRLDGAGRGQASVQTVLKENEESAS